MTITELHKAVRELVPANVTTWVELKVAVFGHRPNETDVTVIISALRDHSRCEIVEAQTAAEALDLFRLKTLRELGLSEPLPALERLAELEGINAPV